MPTENINKHLLPIANPITFFKSDPHNARLHPEPSVQAISVSLKEYGQQKPVVCLADGTVIAGNGMLAAAQRLGWQSLAAVVFEDAAKATAYAIADNRTAEHSKWDPAALVRSLKEITAQGISLDKVGFDADALKKVVVSAHDRMALGVDIIGPDTPQVLRKPEVKNARSGPRDFNVFVGDNMALLPTMADNSVDAVVTDPPYELGFMGAKWDATGIAFNVELWKQVLRVLKPGGHLLAFSGTRTYHRMVCAIEDAGFEIRDQLAWMYGSGFPKSLDVSKAIDDNLGNTRTDRVVSSIEDNAVFSPTVRPVNPGTPIAAEAAAWDGWGTALKPAQEPIVLARKPLEGTVAANVLKWGVGGLNVHGARIGDEERWSGPSGADANDVVGFMPSKPGYEGHMVTGRWPANVLLDDTAAKAVDAQSMEDNGGAARFFYTAKASRSERDAGLDDLPVQVGGVAAGPGGWEHESASRNIHPTVKPVDLMRYLVTLVTPPGGLVLDPFCGSGSTGCGATVAGVRFVGLELETPHACIAWSRIKWWAEQAEAQTVA